ncbi:MAG: peroxidase family protein [Xanthomonadales bacterium]|nr:peroxidase family protein [Xanthomonadales bacterium]
MSGRRAWALLPALLLGGSAIAQPDEPAANPVSPALRLQRDAVDRQPPPPPQPPTDWRSIDGSGNNASDPTMGQAGRALRRLQPAAYSDGAAALAGPGRPSPRVVSNALHRQTETRPNSAGLSDLFWQWGQFLDHDIDLTDGTDPPEPAAIAVPTGDPAFDPDGLGDRTIAFNRSRHDGGQPRQQINEITGWIDASQVYGSNAVRARQLRRLDGSGKLRESPGRLLPTSLDPSLPEDSYQFHAGDLRVNEQVGLISMHTLFLREHNRQAERIARRQPQLDDEQIYQAARAIVGAQMQHITYHEFLPLLLGESALPAYQGYDPQVDGRIRNQFSTAAFRLGHTLLSPVLLRLDANGQPIEAGHLSLADAFFAPTRIRDEGGIEPLLRGLATQRCQQLDLQVVDEVRDFLFGLPGHGGFDLASLNIQRGRDHGLPDYNSLRRGSGQRPARGFRDVNSDPTISTALREVYASVDDIDPWTGLLAEPPRHGIVGETLFRLLRDQFLALRDGDRFWYQRALDRDSRREVEDTRLIDIIRRNTNIGDSIDNDPWHADR